MKNSISIPFNYFLKNDQDAFPFLCSDSVNADINAGYLLNSTDLICPTTAIDPEVELSFRVFPNPVAEWLNVESTGIVALYQIDGRLLNVPVSKNGDMQLLDVSGLAEGLYFLKCQSGVRAVQVLRN